MRGGAISNRPFFGRRLATREFGGWETAAPCEEGRFPIARSLVAAWLLWSPAVGKPPLRARRDDFQSPVLRLPLGFSGVRRLGNRRSVRGGAISNRPFFGRRLASREFGGWETAAPCEEGRFPIACSSVAAWLLSMATENCTLLAIENCTLLATENCTHRGSPREGSVATATGAPAAGPGPLMAPSFPLRSLLRRPLERPSDGSPSRAPHGAAAGSCCPGC